MTAIARLVDEISDDPVVLLDLNDDDPWIILATSKFNPPRARRSRVSSMLVDGATYPASVYDDRVLDLRLLIREATTDDAAFAVQELARQLDKGQNIFELRLTGQAQSVFFRTIRIAMEDIDIHEEGNDQRIHAPIIAEPFGYGLPVDLGVFSVRNDPSPLASSNPMSFDVPEELISGHVEAPMRIKIRLPGSPGFSAADTRMLIATRRKGNVDSVPFLLQAEAMTQLTDTTTQTNTPSMSGSGNNYSRTTFGTNAGLVARLRTFRWPSSPTPDVNGRYRVLGRFRKTVGADTIRVQLRVGGISNNQMDPGIIIKDMVLPTDANNIERIHDLGLVQIPNGVSAKMFGPSGKELSPEGIRVEIWASRSGTGSLDTDWLLFVPADESIVFAHGLVEWEPSADSGVVFDSFNDVFYAHRDTGDMIVNNAVGESLGGFPTLLPGNDNRIYFVRGLYPNVNSPTTVTEVEAMYWPTYLFVRPDDVPAP